MIKIEEIAQLSGYSKTTVSRVLNGDDSLKVKDATREKIIQIAEKHGYAPKTKRAQAVTKKYNKIAVLVHQSGQPEITNPYYEKIKKGIALQAFSENITPIFYDAAELQDTKIEEEIIGVISVGTVNPNLIRKLTNGVQNIIYIGQSPDDRSFSSVNVDLWQGTEDAMALFFNNGYRDIGLIVGESTEISENYSFQYLDNPRFVTYKKNMQEHHQYNPNRVKKGDYTINGGYHLVKAAIEDDDLPEAILIGNDLMAIGALKALQDASLKVPDDVAIISYDDSELAEYASVPLTTVRIPTRDLGKIAVSLLINQVQGNTIVHKIILPIELIVRESCIAKR